MKYIEESPSFPSVPGTVQIPVPANNTCIHHFQVELQSLVIYTPVCLAASLPGCLDPSLFSVTVQFKSDLLVYISDAPVCQRTKYRREVYIPCSSHQTKCGL